MRTIARYLLGAVMSLGLLAGMILGTAPTAQAAPAHGPRVSAHPDRVWDAVHTTLTRLLAGHGLGHVTLERGGEPPEQSPGGKYREVIPLR